MKKSQITPGLANLKNSRGQAVIEYTLMLVISVAMVLAMMQLIFKPFGEFVSNYMGKYMSCLLEYGELPSLGAENPSEMDEDSECDKKFQPGNLTGGRPPNSTGSRSNGTAGKSTTPATQEQTKSESGGGTTAGSASRYGGRNILNRRSIGTESSPTATGKTVEIALEKNGSGGFFGGRKNFDAYGNRGRKTLAVGISGLTEAERKKLEKTADGNAAIVISESQIKQSKKRVAVKPPPERTPTAEDTPLTVGNFIRYLFIAALVIALVIFIGGQALQMSKSGEK